MGTRTEERVMEEAPPAAWPLLGMRVMVMPGSERGIIRKEMPVRPGGPVRTAVVILADMLALEASQ